MKLVTLLCFSIFTHFTTKQVQDRTLFIPPENLEHYDSMKRNAYAILSTKCNVCHAKRNRNMVFTLKNMNRLSPRINEQVFIKKRMPKGKKTRLTESEKIDLKNWINNLK